MNERGSGMLPKLLLALIVVAVAFWAVQHFLSDEARIRRQLGELEDLVGKAEGEGDLIGANKVRKMGDLFTQDFEVSVPSYSVSVRDRGELMRVAMLYRSRTKTATLGFRDVDVAVDKATRTAEMSAVATLSGNDGNGPRRESYRVALSWTQVQGEWLIRRLEVLEILEGTPLLF